MTRMWIGTAAVVFGLLALGSGQGGAATEPPTMQSGGGQSPITGGRTDEQTPQLGTGNRGTGQQGGSLIDPGKVRSTPSGPGQIVGRLLAIQDGIYIVRKVDGQEVALRPDQHTELESTIRIGGRVVAQVDNTGTLAHMKPAPTLEEMERDITR
jgi:hypothetical protein